MKKKILASILISLLALPALALDVMKGDNGLFGLTQGQGKWVVKPKYVTIQRNPADGSFFVYNQSNKWGLLSANGEEVVPCKYNKIAQVREEYQHSFNPNAPRQYADFTLTRDYTPYIRDYVEKKVNAWQKKDEFEKTEDYKARVNEANRKRVIDQAVAEVCEECLMKVQDKKLDMTLLEYDADNETYLVQTPLNNLVVPVSIQNAQMFKKCWGEMTTENTYDMVDGHVVVRGVEFLYNGRPMATYSDRNDVLYARANVSFNFDNIELNLGGQGVTQQNVISEKTIQIGKSDVDVDIPLSSDRNINTHVVIIANENYREEENVKYAHNDGNTFYQYVTQTLGVPVNNVNYIKDATLSNMMRAIEDLKKAGEIFNDIKVIVYYAGHGMPDDATKEAYLIPADGSGKSLRTLYPLKQFYDELAEIRSDATVVFLDACFSGSQRGDGVLASNARAVRIKNLESVPTSNLIVFSATQAGETAWPYEDKDHGMFTYYILKSLKDSKGNITLGELAETVQKEVRQKAWSVNRQDQNPSITPSPTFDDWRKIKLK